MGAGASQKGGAGTARQKGGGGFAPQSPPASQMGQFQAQPTPAVLGQGIRALGVYGGKGGGGYAPQMQPYMSPYQTPMSQMQQPYNSRLMMQRPFDLSQQPMQTSMPTRDPYDGMRQFQPFPGLGQGQSVAVTPAVERPRAAYMPVDRGDGTDQFGAPIQTEPMGRMLGGVDINALRGRLSSKGGARTGNQMMSRGKGFAPTQRQAAVQVGQPAAMVNPSQPSSQLPGGIVSIPRPVAQQPTPQPAPQPAARKVPAIGEDVSGYRYTGKPNMRQLMDLTGVDAKTASDMLYGSSASREDTRDWNAILGSEDPYSAARKATSEMLGGTETFEYEENGRKKYGVRSASGEQLRAGYSSMDQLRNMAGIFLAPE